jgi:hypothetical protein
MHPLANNVSELKESELSNKITDLNKKYFMTNNVQVKEQIAMLLDTYREQLATVQREAWEALVERKNKELDKLINIE